MDHPQTNPLMPAEYYRRHAIRVRKLASETTTPALKQYLEDVAEQYERLAERVEGSGTYVDKSQTG
jgi:hypothetical protein